MRDDPILAAIVARDRSLAPVSSPRYLDRVAARGTRTSRLVSFITSIEDSAAEKTRMRPVPAPRVPGDGAAVLAASLAKTPESSRPRETSIRPSMAERASRSRYEGLLAGKPGSRTVRAR